MPGRFNTLSMLVLICAAVSYAYAAEEKEKSLAPVLYPLDRAAILAGSKFDIKVEFQSIVAQGDVKITLSDKSLDETFGRAATFIEKEDAGALPIDDDDIGLKAGNDADQKMFSALVLRDCILSVPGTYTLSASDGKNSAKVTWEIYKPEKRLAKNVILMIGDGMSLTHRTAARAMFKGINEGKYKGKLAMDSMPRMALIGTSGVDSFVTDSANSAHAYTTGHKSSNAALGVYADRTRNTFDDPKVENIGYLVKRMKQMSVGIVTTSEVQDATPAAWAAHTRSRGDKAAITDFLLEMQPDVLLGGGRSFFMSKLGPNKKQYDSDHLTRFTAAGYSYVKTGPEMAAALADKNTSRLLGLFHNSNLDGVLDRKFLKKGTVDRYPEQPDLPDMAQTALEILSRNEKGFALLVESALIDKFSHRLDWERAVMETIMFDKTVALVKEFAEKRGDTLVLITSDHGHCISIAGVVDDNRNKSTNMRDKVGGGYPNYADADGDGYPDSLDVSRRFAIFFAAFPNYYETFRPKLDGPFTPSELKKSLPPAMVANEKFNVPGAQMREGNLPKLASNGVHAADDVILTGMGPGSEMISGFMDNTEVFRLIANALGLGTETEK